MNVVTFEGIVEQNRIRLTGNVRLPENTKVYVVVPDLQVAQVAHIFSPRLAHPDQAADFTMEVVEESPDAGV
ncbi:MAG TPA: hypothetical protein VJG32_02845 [Anaerolineae bacterium]|nr:hypothetical protein [Anaerolineae bacterium]